jgi:hypothetical protein
MNPILTTLIAPKSADPFPCISNIWSLYAKKVSRTVFLSIGASKAALPDLEIVETLGCPINVVPITAEYKEKWNEIGEVIKERTRSIKATDFSIGAEEKWILPKNFHILSGLPWWSNGHIDISGVTNPVPTQDFFGFMADICKRMALKDGEVRLDILKIDFKDGLERPILFAALEAGFRPGLILVKWSKMPNMDVPTSLCAGHLQNCGYQLINKFENKFAYYYTESDLYMTCSWEETNCVNPMVKDLVDSVRNSLVKSEGPNSHARRFQQSIATPGEANGESVSAPSTSGA